MPRHDMPGTAGFGAPSRDAQGSVRPLTATPFERFLLWERSSRDTIEVKRAYIDMAGDLVAGIMLSQIIYWHLPDRQGQSRLRIERDGCQWIARGRTEWWDECRITPKQADRALQTLRERGIVETRLFRFNGAPTVHLRIKQDCFMQAWSAVLEGKSDSSDSSDSSDGSDDSGKTDRSDFPQTSKSIFPKRQNPFSPQGKIHFPESGRSLTETTTETTSETTTTSGVVASLLNRLIEAGVSRETASELCRTFSSSRIAQQLAILPYREAREPAAVLVKAIRENWAPPASYIRAEERRLRDDRLREEIQRRKREQEQEEYTRETRRAVQDDYWDSLQPHEKTRIESDVERLFAEKYPALARPDIVHRSGRIMSLMKDELRRKILDERMGEEAPDAPP